MDIGGFANMEKTRCSRRDVLRLAGAGVAAGLLPAFPRVPCWAQDLDLAFPRDGIDPEFSWVNQMQGPRPTHVWENWEDLLYDLETNAEPIIRAPEIQPFMKRLGFQPNDSVARRGAGRVPPFLFGRRRSDANRGQPGL